MPRKTEICEQCEKSYTSGQKKKHRIFCSGKRENTENVNKLEDVVKELPPGTICITESKQACTNKEVEPKKVVSLNKRAIPKLYFSTLASIDAVAQKNQFKFDHNIRVNLIAVLLEIVTSIAEERRLYTMKITDWSIYPKFAVVKFYSHSLRDWLQYVKKDAIVKLIKVVPNYNAYGSGHHFKVVPRIFGSDICSSLEMISILSSHGFEAFAYIRSSSFHETPTHLRYYSRQSENVYSLIENARALAINISKEKINNNEQNENGIKITEYLFPKLERTVMKRNSYDAKEAWCSYIQKIKDSFRKIEEQKELERLLAKRKPQREKENENEIIILPPHIVATERKTLADYLRSRNEKRFLKPHNFATK
jgi:hypothetical protein